MKNSAAIAVLLTISCVSGGESTEPEMELFEAMQKGIAAGRTMEGVFYSGKKILKLEKYIQLPGHIIGHDEFPISDPLYIGTEAGEDGIKKDTTLRFARKGTNTEEAFEILRDLPNIPTAEVGSLPSAGLIVLKYNGLVFGPQELHTKAEKPRGVFWSLLRSPRAGLWLQREIILALAFSVNEVLTIYDCGKGYFLSSWQLLHFVLDSKRVNRISHIYLSSTDSLATNPKRENLESMLVYAVTQVITQTGLQQNALAEKLKPIIDDHLETLHQSRDKDRAFLEAIVRAATAVLQEFPADFIPISTTTTLTIRREQRNKAPPMTTSKPTAPEGISARVFGIFRRRRGQKKGVAGRQ